MSEPIEAFGIEIRRAGVDDLHGRLAGARWPEEMPGAGWARGIPVSDLKEPAGYWRSRCNWRAAVSGTGETVGKLVPAPQGAHRTESGRGRHFPATQVPAQLAAGLRAFFGPLR